MNDRRIYIFFKYQINYLFNKIKYNFIFFIRKDISLFQETVCVKRDGKQQFSLLIIINFIGLASKLILLNISMEESFYITSLEKLTNLTWTTKL